MIISEIDKQKLLHSLLLKVALQRVNATREIPINFLKPKQVDCLILQSTRTVSEDGNVHFKTNDILAVLPTGYGKSLIFELLLSYHSLLYGDSDSSVAVIVSPLNSIIAQQKGILGDKAQVIWRGDIDSEDSEDSEVLTSGTETDSEGESETIIFGRSRSPSPTRSLSPTRSAHEEYDSDDDHDDVGSTSGSSTSSKEDASTLIKYYLGHPEQFLEEGVMKDMARSKWAKDVTHIFIDEAHCCVTWSADFRPQFRNLDKLRAVFPKAAVVAVTATATVKMQNEIQRLLAMKETIIISTLVDRPNIKYTVQKRLPQSGRYASAEESYKDVFRPVISELKEKGTNMPKTVIYTGLKWCGIGAELAVREIGGGDQDQVPEVAQYHAPLRPKVKEDIAATMAKTDSEIRLLFATDAYGMGVDCPDVRRVIHAGPPSSLEAYSQQTGRAGRDGLPAEALMYVNNEDLGRPVVNEEMKEYCKLDSCRRQYLLEHFGTNSNIRSGEGHVKHNCCDICESQCECDACYMANTTGAVQLTDESQRSEEQEVAVFNSLAEYFKAVNECFPHTINPAITTGLTETLAKKIALDYIKLCNKDHLDIMCAHLQPEYRDTIHSILQNVCDIIF